MASLFTNSCIISGRFLLEGRYTMVCPKIAEIVSADKSEIQVNGKYIGFIFS
jgi:hypothetical protein